MRQNSLINCPLKIEMPRLHGIFNTNGNDLYIAAKGRLLGIPVESSVLVSNSMASSPLSILEPFRLDEKQLHVNIFSYKYLAVFIVKH